MKIVNRFILQHYHSCFHSNYTKKKFNIRNFKQHNAKLQFLLLDCHCFTNVSYDASTY
ncbi:hypothetical protein KSF78_0001026 [Schistosoma japonicum]|nr:hypothetical protein KSF78_0001026 [Schistosoma japonicum]KAH8852038.1 hypothetical protein KSF78_0001026 [Schistosoma japonicum]KAH8852040.1 hypothetical protein KSF78_0001026 [Schistosoma japonicum]